MEITVYIYIYKWLNYVELNAWASIRIVNRKLSFSISLPTTSSTQDAGKFCTLTTLSHQGCQHSCQPATVCAQSFFARLCFFTSFVYLPTRCDPAASCNMSSPGTCILSFELNRFRPTRCHFVTWAQHDSTIKTKTTSAFSPYP